MKKKVFLVCLIFIFYHVVCIAVNVIPSLFDIQTWYIDTESTFGNKSRIFLSKRGKEAFILNCMIIARKTK